ncbi:MAG: hypothetical protein OEZ68_12695 [Gammaproteobacteria bacterium]|nr:hypothetical protein [Gammaproteobacteria bacterium]MDH5801655.1 hypothetical protein [Gammaproteobacteria bacterium]
MKKFRISLLYLLGLCILLPGSWVTANNVVTAFWHGRVSMLDFDTPTKSILAGETPFLFWITVSLYSLFAAGLLWFWFCYFRSIIDHARNKH